MDQITTGHAPGPFVPPLSPPNYTFLFINIPPSVTSATPKNSAVCPTVPEAILQTQPEEWH